MVMESVNPLCSGVLASAPNSNILTLSLFPVIEVKLLYKTNAETDSPIMVISSNNNIIFFLFKVIPHIL